MSFVRNILFVSLFSFFSSVSAYTIHVLNPWLGQDPYGNELSIYGNTEFTWWAGKPMTNEGDGWFSINTNNLSTESLKIFPTSNHDLEITFGSIASLFVGGTGSETEVWVIIDLKGNKTIGFDKNNIKTINILNPWPENSPSLIINSDTLQMKSNDLYMGWYSYQFMGIFDSLSISFTDYFHSEPFAKNGKLTGVMFEEIDLSPYKDSGNTLFIWPQPKYDGPAKVSTKFPGVLGEANTLSITALVHDHSISEYGFEEGIVSSGVELNIAADELSSDGKIQKGSSNAHKSEYMPSWFEHDSIADTCIDLTLKKTDNGGWEFDSDWTNGFFPIDDWDPFGDGLYYGHNFSFTMELRTQFTYHEGSGQIFEFKGDDDVWVYVNGKLAIDLGGLHEACSGSVNLDIEKSKFGLVDGNSYNLDMFYCERECTESDPNGSSNFRMRTTINLENVSSLFTDEIVTGNEIDINIKKIELGEFSSQCGINVSDTAEIDTVNANIKTYILLGTQFGNDGDTLQLGTNFGGINISGNNISINKDSIVGLALGEYVIMFIDEDYFSGTIKFTVEGVAPLTVDTSGTNISFNNIIEYAKANIMVGFTTDSDCIIYYEILNGTASVSGTGTFSGNGTIEMLSDTVQVKVYAVGDSTSPNKKQSPEETYTFIKNLPNAKLTADPSNDSVYVYTSQFLDVIIETDIGNLIVYQKISATDTSEWDTTANYKDTIQISGDMIINAFTIGTDYNSVSGKWIYDCQLPEITVVANPSDTSFKMNQKILLSAENADTLVNALIKYIIDSTGIGFQADDVKATGVVYDSSIGITITNSVTIYVSAIDTNGDYSDGFGSFTYTLELAGLTITATPSNDPYYNFGSTLDSIALGYETNFSEDVTLTWIMGTSPITDSAAFSTNGTVWDSVTYPSIKSTDSDTMYLSVMGTGHGYETTFKVFKYVRQYLPVVKADPSDPLGYKFSGSLDVELSIDTTLGNFKNIKIYYLLDTTEAGNVASVNDTEISNKDNVTINQTIYIKVIATADNAVTSPFVSNFYILSAGASSAWYKDETAGGVSDTVDGLIDAVTIDLSMPVVVLPDSAQFVSPFDTTDKITVSKSSMEFADSDNDRILVQLPKSFKYGSVDVNTKIDPSVVPNLGTLYGRYYVETPFNIADSVRPLINYAIYYPGAYELIGDSIIIHSDSIMISFSEKVTVPGISGEVNPASFYSVSEGITYDMDLQFDKVVGEKEIKFIVNRITNSIIPSEGDSLRINDIAGVFDSYGNVQNVEANRFGNIRNVGKREYPYTLKALSPVVPSKSIVPEEIKEHSTVLSGFENGVLIVADYYTVLNTGNMIDVKAAIFDQVGNKIASINGYGREKNIGVDVLTIDEPRSKTMVVLVWDGTNNKGRLVASGLYKVLFSFTDPSGEYVISEEIAVGIKQED